jgi:hypothetical protein
MKFTFWAIGAPFLVIGLNVAIYFPHTPPISASFFMLMAVIWFWVGIPATLIYWVARIWRRGTHDGTAPPSHTFNP